MWPILAAIFAVASGAVSYVQARKAQKAAKKANDEQRGVLVNKESNIEQIPVIYGERRVGGVRVFVSTDGTYKTVGGSTNWYAGYHPDTDSYDDVSPTPTNEYLYIALVMAEGEVESITDFIIDDLPITDPKYSGLVGIDVYLGGDNQTMPDTALLREANEFWTAEHRLRGVAFLGVRLKWDEEAFSGIPDITAIVKGKKVYDPRTTTTAWSDNPALCIRDYLTNTRYGKGLPVSAIDDVAIAAAANDCDESVTLYDGGGSGKLFTCNVVLDTSKTLFDNLGTLLLGCRGFLPYSQGKYRLKIDGSRSSEFTFTNDTIIGGIEIQGESKDEKFNRVTVKFPNPDANWQPDTAIWPPADSAEETAYLAEDGGVLLHEEIDLDTITNYYQARDLARVILLRSRNAITCALTTTSEALQLEVTDVVSVTHSTPGWVAKPFQVIGMQLNDDGTVALALLEYDSTVYTWEEGTEQTAYPDTNLPDPFTVGVVSNITVTETTTLGSDGTVIPTGLIAWDTAYDRLVNQYEIQYKLTSEADTEFKSIVTSVTKYEFYNAEVGTSVTIRIRAINSLNVKGAFTTTTFTVNGDQTAPNAPTGIVATAGIKNIRVDWNNPSATDLKIIDVYRHTSNSSGSASKIASINGESFVDQNITDGITYYYWLKAKDYSDNSSGFSGVAFATATLVTSNEILNGAIEIAKFAAGLEPVTLVTSLPVVQSTETVYNTTDNLLYRWNGSEYVSVQGATDFSELTGTINTAQIADAAITAIKLGAAAVEAGKIATNAVTTANIAALAVNASKIASNAVTTAKIAADAVTSSELADNAVTEAVIATNAITATKISDGAIETAKLAAGAVTAAKITAGTITASEIASATIVAGNIATGTITANNIAANTITASNIATGTITANEILSGTITATQIAANTITASKIAANTITATQIAAGAISATEIAAGAITTAKLAALAITADKISANTITAAKIATGTITANEILANTITAGQIATGAITADEIAANAVTVGKMAASSATIATGFRFGLGGGVTISGVTAAGVFESTSASAGVGAIVATNSASIALAAGNTGSSSGSYAIVGYGNLSYSAGNYSGTGNVGALGVGHAGGFFNHPSSGNSATIANASYSAQFSNDVYCGGSYLPFTGSHEALLLRTASLVSGDIIVDTEVVATLGVSDVITKVSVSNSVNDRAAIGVYKADAPAEHLPITLCDKVIVHNPIGDISETTYVLKEEFEDILDDYKTVYVNSVGEGLINVCGEGGDIQPGDLIVTSSMAGKGMKQGDDIIRSYTVAKARESATFSAGEVKMIACIYLCG